MKFDNSREEWFKDRPVNLVDLYEDAVLKYSRRPSLGVKNKNGGYTWHTFKESSLRIDNLRGGLASLGIGKDDAVGIIMNNSPEYAIAAFATYGRGAWFIPMYEKDLTETWEYIISDSGIKLLFTASDEIFNKVKGFSVRTPGLKHIIRARGEGRDTMAELEKIGRGNPVKSIKPHWKDTAGIIYTSGTTGEPKGVVLSHGNYTSILKSINNSFSTVTSDDVTFIILPWAHVFGQVGELFHGIYVGASGALMDTLDTISGDIKKARPTALVAVPRVFNSIYNGIHARVKEKGGIAEKLFNMAKAEAVKARTAGRGGLKYKVLDKLVFSKIRKELGGRLRMAITGRSVINEEIKMFFMDLGIDTYDCYGLTESSIALTFNSPVYGNKMGSVGRPGKNIRIVIDRSRTGEGSRDGEIIAYGPNIMQGYHNKPEKTAEVMTMDGGLRTGDRGWLDDEGYLYITGRFKEEYKLANGKYVHPVSIEEEIKLNRYISNAFVYGANRDYNVALIVPDFPLLTKYAQSRNISAGRPEDLIGHHELREFLGSEIWGQLKGNFGTYEIPKKFLYSAEPFTTENGFLTQTMKLKRSRILEVFGNELDALYG